MLFVVAPLYLSRMNYKKLLPFIFFLILAFLAIGIKRCNIPETTSTTKQPPRNNTSKPAEIPAERKNFDRNISEIFFTKHAKCRMQCRRISQQEVKDILKFMRDRIMFLDQYLTPPILFIYNKEKQALNTCLRTAQVLDIQGFLEAV